MVNQNQLEISSEIQHACAYSFPAVLSVMGSEHWKEMKGVFLKLSEMSVEIKAVIAC
jgi:hypothetical protein